jgi:hypothetical protein
MMEVRYISKTHVARIENYSGRGTMNFLIPQQQEVY